MDASTMTEIWVQLATNSPFLGFVMYNWYQMSKQNESYRIEMKNDRDNYERQREEGIEKIRDRYFKVIESLKIEKEELRKETERVREKCENEKNQILLALDRKIERIEARIK